MLHRWDAFWEVGVATMATAMIVAPSTPPMPRAMQETTEPAAAAPAVAVSPSPSPPQADHNGIGQYHFLRTLGRGSSGTVKLAWHKLTHAEVCARSLRTHRTRVP